MTVPAPENLVQEPQMGGYYPRIKYAGLTLDAAEALIAFPDEATRDRGFNPLSTGKAEILSSSRIEERAVLDLRLWTEQYAQFQQLFRDHSGRGRQFELWLNRFLGSAWSFEGTLKDQNGLALALNTGTLVYKDTERAQRHFHEMFAVLPTTWTAVNGSGTETIETGQGPEDAEVYQSDGYRWRTYPRNIAFDPSKLYRIRVRARRTATVDALTQFFYCGVAGVAADGVTLVNKDGDNTQSSQHYVAASGEDASLWTLNEWQEYEGWFKGYAIGAGSQGEFPNRAAPARLHKDVRFFRPLFIVNHNGGPTGNVMQVDFITVDEFNPDGGRGVELTGTQVLNVSCVQASAATPTGFDDVLDFSEGCVAIDVIPYVGNVNDATTRRFIRVGTTGTNSFRVFKQSSGGGLQMSFLDGAGGQRDVILSPAVHDFNWEAGDWLRIVAAWRRDGMTAIHASVNGAPWESDVVPSGAGNGKMTALPNTLTIGGSTTGTEAMNGLYKKVVFWKYAWDFPLRTVPGDSNFSNDVQPGPIEGLHAFEPVCRNYWPYAEKVDPHWRPGRAMPGRGMWQYTLPVRLGRKVG